ncbi:hypothetical protein [Streptomyces variegatus]|uniref:hypothetical protein n=1 Tax=Streptomyces variegatus TaxID=284040 RepID=UPI003C2C0567
MSPFHPPARPFAELRPTGLLWLINRVVFHPRGLALALHADDTGHVYGWSLLPSPDGGPWTYPEDVEPDYLRSAEATLTAALNTPVHPDEDVRPPSRPTPDEDSGRPGRVPVLGARPLHPTSADAVRPGADETPDAGRTRDRRAEVRQAIDSAFLAPRCSCGQTGDLLAVDPAGLHAHGAPAAEEQPHPAVAWWWSAYERAHAAEVRLSAVRDVIADMEHTTGARQWARMLALAVGEPVQDDKGTWRRRAVRSALALSRAHGLIAAVCDLAHEDAEEDQGPHGDGYRQALADLRAVLVAFEHLPDETRLRGPEVVHTCPNPQLRASVEVADMTVPVVHGAHPRRTAQGGTR